MRRTLILLALICLPHCATKHQPVAFTPYFSVTPANELSTQDMDEIKALEAKSTLEDFEKKHLWELYNLELKTLKSTAARYQDVVSALRRLQPDIVALRREVESINANVVKFKDPTLSIDPPPAPLEHLPIKRAYHEAARLWNRDQDETALKKISAVVANPTLKAQAGPREWTRVLTLQIRIALDVGDLKTAEGTYQSLKAVGDCSPEAAQAAFLVSLHQLARNRGRDAMTTYGGQCDPDKSSVHLLQRKYWQARFAEAADATAGYLFQEIAASHIPSYYVYLAKRRLESRIQLAPASPTPGLLYLGQEMSLPREVDSLLKAAELRLQHNLRRDAGIYALRGAQLLKAQCRGPGQVSADLVAPLLYTAHLLQASGNHLEAMRIYSLVTTTLEDNAQVGGLFNREFLNEMFPRPYSSTVEWLSRQWNTDPDFIYAIMRQESAFNPGALSMARARGLMQLMPSLARLLSRQWSYDGLYNDRLLFNAHENLKLATFHLYQLGARAPHLALVAAAYNAGLSRVQGWWRRYGTLPLDVFVELVPVNETRNYIKVVLRNYLYYKALHSTDGLDSNLVPLALPPYGTLQPPKLTATRPRPRPLAAAAKPTRRSLAATAKATRRSLAATAKPIRFSSRRTR